MGADISGTFFRMGGEPFTEGKAEVLERAGVQGVSQYSMSEVGRIANACAAPSHRDDTHFMSEKLAVIQTEPSAGANGAPLGTFSYTSLLPSAPKVLINVESDDYGVLEQRRCGCAWEELGFTTHLHGLHSQEKLTSEGNHFLGSDLYALVEQVLPARFGGHATDYQLVEEEEGGLPKVSVIVRPGIGPVADHEVVEAVLAFLRAEKRNRLMAEVWAQYGTVRVVRAEPRRAAPNAKLVPLLSVRDD
jgi:phenylacetate-coenzyme A ligase PaaK-like adenylate-forming protein